MTVFITLLRAVNVGGTGKLSMAAFRAACEQADLRNVSTYIASGNLVCSSNNSSTKVRDTVSDILHDRFALTNNQAIIRTTPEWAQVVACNPFADAASERPNLLQVHFLDDVPADGTLGGFIGPERLHLDGRHLYIDYVAGIGRSKLTPAFLDRHLRVSGTARNWNTVQKLLDMAQTVSESDE